MAALGDTLPPLPSLLIPNVPDGGAEGGAVLPYRYPKYTPSTAGIRFRSLVTSRQFMNGSNLLKRDLRRCLVQAIGSNLTGTRDEGKVIEVSSFSKEPTGRNGMANLSNISSDEACLPRYLLPKRQVAPLFLGKLLEFLRIEFNMDPEENFNPNTEVDETLDSDMDPEENFNSNTEVDETPDSNMEENVTQRTGEKRKGRGAVICSRLTKMKENERVDVVFNQNGQRIGEGGKDLASYSGLLAAFRVSIATYGNWHDVKGEARDRLWKFIKVYRRSKESRECFFLCVIVVEKVPRIDIKGGSNTGLLQPTPLMGHGGLKV
ncbi:hypothetical protein IFM89_009027 [Coptis chinensis]|uniref:Uncharacterized protein n=1 Tax=Coptis chinensis TaxID=261450 RepID=A0A835LLY2_9MAGN|nr:hypothetical protein IFM89_009027 [Coptis chinensis]